MAYNPYPYGGYQPAPNYYPGPVPDQLAQLRQNQMPQAVTPPQPMQTNMGQVGPASGPQNGGIIWVNGKAEADSYLVAPNSAVPLWDANNPVIYLRKADSTGKPSTVVYDLVERTDAPASQQAAPQVDWSQFITRDQLEDILAERFKRPTKATKVKEDTENG